MAYQKVGIGSTANDGTGDTLRVGADKINENFEDLFAKINGVANSAIADGTALSSDNVVLRTSTDTLTNKTLTSPTLTTPIINGATIGSDSLVTLSNGDINLAPNGTGKVIIRGNSNQGKIILNCEANSHGQTIIAAPHSESANNVLTLPSSGGDARLVSTSSTATLTNKTLTAPKIADAGFIADSNGNEQIIFQETSSAVNEIEITNAATGGAASAGASTAPIIGASGETNVDLALLPKGTGHVAIRSTGGTNNQGAIRLNCENNTHGQTLMSQPHSAGDSGFFMLPKDGGSARATPNVLLSGAKTIGASETVSGNGASNAVSLDTLVTLLNTSGGTSDLTLAAGTVGQIKIISMHTAGNAATMTTSNGNLAGMNTSIVWDAVGEGVTLLYNGTKWVVVGQFGVTIS